MRRRAVREPPLRRALTATRRILVTAGFSLGRRDVCATFFKITGGWEGSLRGGRGIIYKKSPGPPLKSFQTYSSGGSPSLRAVISPMMKACSLRP